MNTNSHFSHPPQALAVSSLSSVPVTFITYDSLIQVNQCLFFYAWLTLVTIMYSRFTILSKCQSSPHFKANNILLHMYIYSCVYGCPIFFILLMTILVFFFFCVSSDVNNGQWTWECWYRFKISSTIALHKYLKVKLYQNVILILIFWGAMLLFTTVAVLSYMLSTVYQFP